MNTTTVKTKTQKVSLHGPNLSREQARKIQKAINDRLAGKNVDVTAVFPVITAGATSNATKLAPVKTLKTKVAITYTEQSKTYRNYYADGGLIATVRESRSNPGTFRFKTFNTSAISTFPFAKELSFKSFKAANEAFLKYLGKYASFKTPTKQTY